MLCYRNDVKIRKDEAIKLIVDLGGKYDKAGGKGRHTKGILFPYDSFSLCGKEVYLAEFPKTFFEGQRQVVTLTEENVLDLYQVAQMRNALIKAGFGPRSE